MDKVGFVIEGNTVYVPRALFVDKCDHLENQGNDAIVLPG